MRFALHIPGETEGAGSTRLCPWHVVWDPVGPGGWDELQEVPWNDQLHAPEIQNLGAKRASGDTSLFIRMENQSQIPFPQALHRGVRQ